MLNVIGRYSTPSRGITKGIDAMQESRNVAILKAQEYMANQGYKHGPCIGAECKSPQSKAVWDVEFAHDGLHARSTTTDPPSIVLVVNLDLDSIRIADVM